MLHHRAEVLTAVYPKGGGEGLSGRISLSISRPQELRDLSEDEGGV